MKSLEIYLPYDRRIAIHQKRDMSDCVEGSALFADISGFTPLTQALTQSFGDRRGAELLTQYLNQVYEALITDLHRYSGSVIGFSGDAITCWFEGDTGERAIICALAMQKTMQQFAETEAVDGVAIELAIKVAVSVGAARRFQVGDRQIQYLDVLAGETINGMAAAEKQAQKGEIVLTTGAVERFADKLGILEWRTDSRQRRFAVISSLNLPQISAQTESCADDNLFNHPLPKEDVRPWLLQSVYQRLKAEKSRFLTEFRPVAALFLNFTGLDYDQDADAGEKLDAYINWAQQTLQRYGGSLLQLTFGDKGSYLYAAFGAPVAYDNHSERAVEAAIKLLSPPECLRFIAGIRIGLSQGRMWTGAYGAGTRQTYGVLGDEVNLAARLMSQAEAGQILVSPRIVKALQRHYIFKPLASVEVKGKGRIKPSAWVDKVPVSIQRPITLFSAPLVGRAGEISQLNKRLKKAMSGQGQVVRVEGEAGVGKSHLTAEFVEQAQRQGVQVVVGLCQNVGPLVAYHPWRQIFRALLSVTADANESSALTQQLEDTLAKIYPEGLPRLPLLGDLFNIHIQDNNLTSNFDSKMRQDALFALAVDILRSKAATQSLLLLIDDIHKLDGASQELALFIAKNLEDTPILFLLAQRPEEILPELDNLSYYHALALSSLPDDDIDKLIVNRLKDRVSPLAQKLLHLRAQGNPFFVEALIDELRESKRLIKRSDNIWRLSRPVVEMLRQANCLINVDDEWELSPDASWETVDLGIPVALDSLILSRVDRLPDAHRLTLKAAAVLGNSFEAPLLSHLRDLPPSMIAECLAQIAVRGLIRPESSAPQPVYRFRHNIIQETIYNSLSDSQRKMLHRRAGEALEERAPFGVERLAYHFRLSNVNNPAIRSKAMSYLEKAAEKTRREYANEAALHYYNHALALEERWQWLKSKAEILHLTGDRDAEYQTLQKLQHKEDVPDFDITYLWGDYYEATSKSDEAEKHYEAALKIARAQDNTVDALRALIQVGFVMTKRANYEDALVKYQETILFCQMLPPSGQSEEIEKMQAQIFNGAGTAHLRLGHYDQAAMYYQKGLDISRKWGVQWQEARALEGLGNATTYRQQFLEGRKYLKQALLIWKKIGDISRESSTLYNLGINFQEAGEYERALTTFENALSIHQKIKNLYEQINVLNSLGSLYLRFGLLSEALNHLEQGLKIAAESNDSEGRAFLLSTLGMVVKYQREFKRAEEYLREGLDFAKIENNEGQMAVFLSYLGMVSLESGNLRQSINYAQQALDIRGSLEGSMRIANDLATLAAAYLDDGKIESALANAQQAKKILDRRKGRHPGFSPRIYFICYQVFEAAGQDEQADAALRSAYELLINRSQQIADVALRQSFLKNVAVNQDIAAAAKKRLALIT